LKEHKFLERADIDKILWDNLPAWMTEKQKKNKIANLLTELRQNGEIQNIGTDYKSKWVIFKRGLKEV
jgi:hypothetical protein